MDAHNLPNATTTAITSALMSSEVLLSQAQHVGSHDRLWQARKHLFAANKLMHEVWMLEGVAAGLELSNPEVQAQAVALSNEVMDRALHPERYVVAPTPELNSATVLEELFDVKS